MATTDTITSTGTWVAPTGIIGAVVECWGAGGDTGTRGIPGGNGGGGGGAYARKTLTNIVPGVSYTVTVGVSGGSDSWFKDTSTVLAKGGSNVANDTDAKGLGGLASACIGDVTYSGGDGADGGGAGTNSGGGGGGAGSTGAGGNASGVTHGAGTTVGGGDGGDGFTINNNANAGSTYGGGAGGAFRSSGTRSGALGASGRVTITYAIANGTEVSGTPVEVVIASYGVVGSDVSGVPFDSAKVKYGWQNQSKNDTSWINQNKN